MTVRFWFKSGMSGGTFVRDIIKYHSFKVKPTFVPYAGNHKIYSTFSGRVVLSLPGSRIEVLEDIIGRGLNSANLVEMLINDDWIIMSKQEQGE